MLATGLVLLPLCREGFHMEYKVKVIIEKADGMESALPKQCPHQYLHEDSRELPGTSQEDVSRCHPPGAGLGSLRHTGHRHPHSPLQSSQ